jgi:hypothetical protein
MVERHTAFARVRFLAATAATAVFASGCNDSLAASANPTPIKHPAASAAAKQVEVAPPPTPRGADRVVTFQGTCDASGAVEVDSRHFAVADDEDNVIRVYDADRGGPPLHVVNLSPQLPLAKPMNAESDFEAATRLGEHSFFLASHGRTAKAKRDPDRLLFFATTMPALGSEIRVLGQPYRSLLEDLASEPALAAFNLRAASDLAPKAAGGLNLEGLTAEPDGSLLLGFRSPIPEGRALLIALLNPREMLAGRRARFAKPLRLDLQGLGVRSLSTWGSDLLIVAGPSGDGGPFRLFRYDRRDKLTVVPELDFTGFGPEGLFTPEARGELLVLSDDGTRVMHGKACKKLRDGRMKSFRGVWVKLPQ